MDTWVLKVELNGEWEECTFRTCKEALDAFMALAADYELHMRRAVLLAPTEERKPRRRLESWPVSGQFVN